MSKPVIGFAGLTHLGINSAAAAAARGFATVWFDPSNERVASIEHGALPLVEPGLPELIKGARARIRLTSEAARLGECDVVYIASDVPTDDSGQSDLSGIQALIDLACSHMRSDAVLVVLCQVPPGFTRALSWPASRRFYQVETLIFGRAVERAMHPERFIIGCAEPDAALPSPYRELLSAFGCPLLPMRYESAELAKIAINCCLVSAVTVANTLAELSERIGADWHEIVPALRLDRRIGEYAYLAPGLGLSGGNLERDLATVLTLAGQTGSEAGLISAFLQNSAHRRDWALRTLHREVLDRTPAAVIGILGLAYKENTHSTRNSPSLALIRHLHAWMVQLHDPVVPSHEAAHPNAVACATPADAARGADALVVMTPWPQYRELDATALAASLRGRVVIDPYRVFDGARLAQAGFYYHALGAPAERGRQHA